MTVLLTQEQLELVLEKLDALRLEVLRLRAQLLAEEEPSREEIQETEQARKEIEEGKAVTLEELLKEFTA